jgi:putative ABC transport system permease protein
VTESNPSQERSGSVSKLGTAIGLALDSIRAHKLRSFLTLLGMIIGVASVILVGAAIDGLGSYTESITAKAFGSDSFMISQIASLGRLSARELAEKQRVNKRIRPDDVTYLRQVTGQDVIYSPYQNRTDDVKGDNQVYEGASILGVSATLPAIRDVPVVEGRFFNDTEEEHGAHVAVIGDDIRTALFPDEAVIGKVIRVGGQEFTVIGLLERQGSSFGQSLDNPVYIPTSTYTEIYGSQKGMAVFGKSVAGSGLSMDAAMDETRTALRSRFHAQPGKPDNFDTLTPDSIRSFVGQILGVIAAVVVPVTGISLVVGGIVVMNIMLVSVTERTREIGIRKSLGARRSDIMLQFLTESVILSLFGGCFGVALGALAAFVASKAVCHGVGICFERGGHYFRLVSGQTRRHARSSSGAQGGVIYATEHARNTDHVAGCHLVAQNALGADYPRDCGRHHNGGDGSFVADRTQ